MLSQTIYLQEIQYIFVYNAGLNAKLNHRKREKLMKAQTTGKRVAKLTVVGKQHDNLSIKQTRAFGSRLTVRLTPRKGNQGKEIVFRRFPLGIKKVRLVDDRKGTHKCWLLVMVVPIPTGPYNSSAVRAWLAGGREVSVGPAYLSM